MVEATLVGVDPKIEHLVRQITKLQAKVHILTLNDAKSLVGPLHELPLS